MLGLAALVAAGGTSTVQAAPATGNGGASITNYDDCPVGAFCGWDYLNGNGSIKIWTGPDSDLRSPAPSWNDRIRSVWNRTGAVWCTFPDINYADVTTGPPNPWPVGNWRGNTALYNMDMNISSLRPGRC
ncbi:peptidase inhibitor family I36 protein [Amycolatopsis thailandensis]|uniref:peptidase inhibitor family I36 protein n=1 Tax=Amycolatopsis thailandensis TaxID=589330 RepID=UPI00142E5A8D|nr:peptidase inhibitor family I36 protein [Amycolatopsis thailandensis]